MASSTLLIPPIYHKPRKTKLETTKVRSEDELLKFFLHGSYDVQRGNKPAAQIEQINNKIECSKDETTTITSNPNTDDKKSKSRCMFEETYMINISVKQPDTTPLSKQIDVRIEKTPSDTQISDEKIDDDEISSIFDEEENDEVDSVIFNEINSSTSEPPSTKLTLADMINKTLTTISSSPSSVEKNPNWYIEQQNEIQPRKTNETKPSTLTTNIAEDEKLFKYLDYLETKEESPKTTSKSTVSTTKIPLKPQQQEPLPIIDLEQLCRSLTVIDLKDEFIRKKIYELKILIDEQHKKQKSQIPIIKPTRKDNIPILIAMPPVAQQRRRTTAIQPPTLLHSKTVNLQVPYLSNYQDIISIYNNKQLPPNKQQFSQRQIPSTNSSRKYQYT